MFCKFFARNLDLRVSKNTNRFRSCQQYSTILRSSFVLKLIGIIPSARQLSVVNPIASGLLLAKSLTLKAK